MKKKISITINEKILKGIDSIVDNLFIRNRSQAIEYLLNNFFEENKTAVILAGGEEKNLEITKNKYATDFTIEKILKKLRESGFKTVYIISRNKILTNLFQLLKDGSEYGVKIEYIEEKNSNGTADSLRLLKGKINNNFLVVYGDILFDDIKLDEIWAAHLKQKSIVTLMLTTSPIPSKKGAVKMEGNKIIEFIQKPKKSDSYLVFSPIFVVEPELLNYSGDKLENDIFPNLAVKNLLSGYLSSKKEIHIHDKKDLININQKF